MQPNPDIMREKAVKFAMREMQHATESQEIEHALANDEELGNWLRREYGNDGALAAAQGIISKAENRMGNRLLANYG